ncbi:MAG TPA: hypothetical protein VHR18_09910 [Solirubrobacterales bacterium]|jgi:hypothetical protein|nr:hypothetical protein [Solirubrobacterales bacterium]
MLRAGIKTGALGLALVASAVCLLALASSGVAAVPGCGSFKSQAAAQDEFFELGGTPQNPVGRLDPDRDGVACEGLPGPYKGYAMIGYNRKKQFFYGVAKMPPANGGAGYPCLRGNRHFDDAPRKVNIFRITPSGDKSLLGEFQGKAEAQPETGQLFWKAEIANPPTGRYYVTFVERIPLTPYGPNECPGFSSQPTLLPRPTR